MNDQDKTIEDMSLNEKTNDKDKIIDSVADMALGEGPDSVQIGTRIQKLFPDIDIIDIDDFKILKMANGSYTVRNLPLKKLGSKDLKKIDDFLKEKEGAK